MAAEQAVVKKSSSISNVWFIPILALLLGAYMVLHSWMTEGPEIEIAFNTAEGLEQGKTKIKYRNVDMGVVDSVRLNEQFDGVIATAKLDRQAEALLREDTRFWVVTASVSVDRITGLDTLLSGAYIQLAPGTGQDGWRHFEALEQAPLTDTDADGLRLHLTSREATSITTGDAVLYHGFKVGRVEGVEFDATARMVDYVIFIDSPYHKLVNTSVRFWDASGISISAGADGFQVEIGSLDTVFLGGMAFGTPPGMAPGDPVDHNAEFRLYASFEEIQKNPYKFGTYYVVSFSQSVKGLQPGAPVEYRGIPIGRVERLMLRDTLRRQQEDNTEGTGAAIPVLIYLEPARLEMPDRQTSIDAFARNIATGVSNGMRASLESGSIITGAKFVNIDYYADAEPAQIGTFLDYPTIPTIETGLGQIQYKVESILDKVNNLPLEDTVAAANNALASLDDTLASLDHILENESTRDLTRQLQETLSELQSALGGLSPGSGIYQSLDASLLQLNRTLDNIESLTGTLAKKPNAVVFPTTIPADPEPEARP
ncbi:MAG: intermembrane transport protein PqiB [Halioglobus sp.]